jgi:hypothetical protein
MDLYIRGWYLSKGCDLAWIRSIRVVPASDNVKDAIKASSDTVGSEMRQMKQC